MALTPPTTPLTNDEDSLMSSLAPLQPSRRTVLRSAAWSTAAVTVVVATPNIAAASPGSTPTGTAVNNGSTRDGKVLNVKSKITNTGPTLAMTGLQAIVTLTGGTFASITAPTGWVASGSTATTRTFTYTGSSSIPVNGFALFEPVVTMTTNPAASVTANVQFTWATSGNTVVAIPLAYVAPAATITHTSIRKFNDSADASLKHVEWKFTLTNSSATQTLHDLNLDFAWSGENLSNPTLAFTVVTAGRTWTTTMAGLTAILTGAGLAPGASLSITADFMNKNNAGGNVGVVVYSGTTKVTERLNVIY